MTDTMLMTHTDLDGVGCGVIFGGATRDHGPIELVENGQIDERVRDVLHDRMATAPRSAVLVTDHGVNEATAEVVDAFIEAGGSFTLLDHHRSSQEIAHRPWATVDESRSATGLLFDHLGRPPAFAEFARLVEDHDLWRHEDVRSARLASLIGLLGPERFLARFSADPSVQFRSGELLLLELEEARREEYLAKKVEQARTVEISGHLWAVCYAEQYQSDLAERLMSDLHVQATAIVNPGRRTVSLRGRGVDVSAVAQRFGGGGHARAAAFSFKGQGLEVELVRFERALDEVLAGRATG